MPHSVITAFPKIHILSYKNLPESCWSGKSKRLPHKQERLLPSILNLKTSHHCWRYHTHQTQDLLKLSKIWPEILPIDDKLSWCPKTLWKLPRLKGNQYSYPAVVLTISQQWPPWQDIPKGTIMALLSWGNQKLSNWTFKVPMACKGIQPSRKHTAAIFLS